MEVESLQRARAAKQLIIENVSLLPQENLSTIISNTLEAIGWPQLSRAPENAHRLVIKRLRAVMAAVAALVGLGLCCLSHVTFQVLMQTSEELAASGFYYTGRGDRVICLRCGLGLKGWCPGETPNAEHRKWKNNCPILKFFANENHRNEEAYTALHHVQK
ncbi:hypothetical protein B566_EDAN014830 [Ephemera danica]|nr:hypothetical protein B566_EDAN014830 [Ephemera danica]